MGETNTKKSPLNMTYIINVNLISYKTYLACLFFLYINYFNIKVSSKFS